MSLYKNFSNYQAYLLRIWRRGQGAAPGEDIAWQASLEDPHTGERFSFKDLDSLFGFLSQQTFSEPPALDSGPEELS